jgi:hypothetical protein
MAGMTPLEAALAAHAAGLAAVPPREDGTKAPLGEWKRYQARLPTEAELRAWYRDGRAGLGVVCGAVSGGLECLEFEAEATYQTFMEAAQQLDLGALVERVDAGYAELSPGGGVHWLYRCPNVAGNTKLAREPGPDGPKVLIETRGEGGYVITAPSNGRVHPSGRPYVLLRGGFTSIATITPKERAAMHRLARSFDRMPEPERPAAQPAARVEGAGGGRPGDDFNQRAAWAELLQPVGWTLVGRRGDVEYWRRPGKQPPGWSATVGHFRGEAGEPVLCVFSTSTPFEAERPYSKFAAYTLLRHGGDWTAAARDLARRGYGASSGQSASPAMRPRTGDHPPTLDGLLEAMGAYLYLDDPDHVLIALAIAVSAELDGPPLWVMLVGAPSGGKTEAIEVLRGRGAHLDELTNAGLLGWKLGKGKATPPVPDGALVRLGKRGLLTISDMSTLLAREQRSGSTVDQLFANLRRVHDGHLSRGITPPPGAIGELRWEGRATLLAACTPAIDRFAGHAEQLGPRWVYFRLRRPSRDTQRRRQRKVHTAGQLEEARATARQLAGQLVDQAVPRACDLELSGEMAERIFDAAQLTCWGRGAVPRHWSGKREIDGFPVVEDTPRVTWQLLMLARCLLALGQSEAETLRLVRRAALGSMPENRSRALAELRGGVAMTGRELARALKCDVGVALRTAEDLAALELLEWPDDEDLDDAGRPFPQPKLWRFTDDDDRRELVESVLDVRAFCLVAPVAEVDTPQPPSPQKIRGNGQDGHSRGTPLSTSTTGLTSDDDPPPLTDADDPERLIDVEPDHRRWTA